MRFLRDHTAEELLALIRYAYEAQTPEATFWRGGNEENREYLDLENLLRISKVDSRVERALAWLAGEDPHDPEGPTDDDPVPSGPVQPRQRAPVPTKVLVPVRGRSLSRKPRV